MRNILIVISMIFGSGGCVSSGGPTQVTFVYFNISSNAIWITDMLGLPRDATPGRLEPVHGEDQLSEASSSIPGTVRVPEKIRIIWKENGKQGWPGGVKPPGSVPPGVTHEAEFKRSDLGIPTDLRNGKVRFTYLGDDKWRIKTVAD
jgi:hypothetical protein